MQLKRELSTFDGVEAAAAVMRCFGALLVARVIFREHSSAQRATCAGS